MRPRAVRWKTSDAFYCVHHLHQKMTLETFARGARVWMDVLREQYPDEYEALLAELGGRYQPPAASLSFLGERHLRRLTRQVEAAVVRVCGCSLVDMPDVWIGFNSADRQRYWWRTSIMTLVLTGVMVAAGLTTPAPDRWWLVGGFGVFLAALVFGMLNWIYGQTLLTTTGLKFRTFVSRRSIPWSEVAGIESRHRVSRSGIWWDLRVVRARGRSLTLPGTLTNRMMDAELERKQAVIQERWSCAVGD